MNKTKAISVSIMCGDLMNMGREIDNLKELGVEYLHIDVMDAHFVPNLTFGPDLIRAVAQYTDMAMDVHLMMDNPRLLIDRLTLRPGDILSCHVEVEGQDYADLAASLHDKGILFGLAISPDTPVEALKPHIEYLDTVTVMTVYPGFAGAKLVEGILPKVGAVRELLDSCGGENILVSVDGSVSFERAEITSAMGCNIFVGGTSAVYRKDMSLKESISRLRESIGK